MITIENSASDSGSFVSTINGWAFAFGRPVISGRLKAQPDDFRVTELMDVELTGEGEHFWLDVSKQEVGTDRVAKALARHANVSYRDVGYAGMKDVQAVTRQWFSVWMPKHSAFDWSGFSHEGVTVHSVEKHNRKLKRGAHQGNQFEIQLSDLSERSDELRPRLEQIASLGVPNYFGEQRFGRSARNLISAKRLFNREIKIKDRTMRGMVLSSARSFLFNQVVSERVRSNTWCELFDNEPAALNGSNAIFVSRGETENRQRLNDLDIHPTAPLWGRIKDGASTAYQELADLENSIVQHHDAFCQGLESAGLDYQRRALRLVPNDFSWQFRGNSLLLNFALQSGQFATSVIRELISEQP